MTSNNSKTSSWIYLPLLFCSSAAIAAGQSTSSPQFEDEFREVNNANYDYVGGKTRVGVGIDTEFDGTADISHIFSESKDTATSGDAWIGFDFSGENKGVNAGGVKLNHHWVSRDAQGRPLRVNKIFGAYDRNNNDDDRATVGYGQEVDKGFWEGYVGRGLSRKREIGRTNDGRVLSEKGYKYSAGGQIGTFLPGSNIRVRGGLDYAWDNERGVNESKPEQLTLSAGVEKFFQGTPHSVSLDVATSRKEGGFGDKDTDTRANLSYRYDLGGADIYQSDQQYKRVRVETPGHAHPARTVRKAIKTPYKQAYKKAVKVRACQLVKSTVELGSDTFFKPNSSKLLPSAKKRLTDVLGQIRRTGYKGNIRITGNTCDIGSLKHNQVLSERRASAVKRYFAKHGFERSELVARGLGETTPKYPNTKGNRHKNRRVDIEYVTQDASCKDGYKTIYKTAYKTAYKTEYKNVVVQQAGISKPSVTWKTEVVQAEPAWIKRALHNSIRHDRHISTYQTTAGSSSSPTAVLPILINDTATTTEGAPVTIDVLANDTGNGLSITSVTQPANGSVSIVDGAVVFTPNQGFVGTDVFTYTVTNSTGGQSQATVNVTVTAAATAVNVAPIAQADAATTTTTATTGQAVTIDVLANDSDADGDALSIETITQPVNGSTAIVNGQVVYTPTAGFVGTDTFTYTISDGNGHTTTATVTVVVTDAGNGSNNLPPVAQDDNATSDGTAVTIDVLNNDTDVDDDTLTITSTAQPSNGTAVISNEQIVYTPNQGFVGSDSFTYTISDGNGHNATATVYVLVTSTTNNGNNVAPIAQDDNATSDGSAVTIDVLSDDTDADSDTLTIADIGQPSNGTAAISNGQVVYTPNQGFVGSDSFTYTISDGNGHNATATVYVLVTSTTNTGNNVAPIAQDDSASTSSSAVTIDVLNNDSDADNDTLTVTGMTQPDNGAATMSNGDIVYTPNQDFTGTDTFTYTISDNNGHTTTANVAVDVTATPENNNVAPIANADNATTSEGSVTVDVLYNDTDADGDTLTITNTNQPAHGQASIVNGQILYTPNQGFVGLDSFTYIISDGHDHTSSSVVSITVEGSSATENQAPDVNDDYMGLVAANETMTIHPLTNDSDPDGDTLQIISVGTTPNGSAVVSGDGAITFTPANNYCGNVQFDYTVTDGHGHTKTATVHMQVELL